MQVQAARLARQHAKRVREPRAADRPVDRRPVVSQPIADRLEEVDRGCGQRAVALRTDVQQQVAAARRAHHESTNDLRGRLPMAIRRVPSPRVVRRHARLPPAERRQNADRLLRRREITRDPRAVVHEDARLQFARHCLELERPPRLARMGPEAVVPERGDLAVPSEQLEQLPVHVGAERSPAVGIAERATPVRRGPPVEQRVVQAHTQARGPERVDPLGHEIAAGGRVRGLEMVGGGVPEAEPVVVARDEHSIAHAGAPGERGLRSRVPSFGRELLAEAFVLGNGDVLSLHDPVAAGRQRHHAPVDEQPVAGVVPPGRVGHAALSRRLRAGPGGRRSRASPSSGSACRSADRARRPRAAPGRAWWLR